ncbi:MAG: YdeI/OmpD-associated family protein [Chloroflexota bacterium]
MEPTFFETPSQFRAWLEEHHAVESELLVGFRKKGSGYQSITWPQSVDQALCFGWIDGVRRRIDDISYSIRFTPRKSRSTWSAVNIARMKELTGAGLVYPAGLQAFEARTAGNSELYAYEQEKSELDAAYMQQLRANNAAWEFFQSRPPWYRKTATWWVMSAKREETRLRRLATLIEDSAHHRTIRSLTRPAGRR